MLIDQPILNVYDHGGCRITCLVTGEEWKQNTYIVTHKSTANTIVVDPGDNAERIIQLIEDVKGKLTNILLTHPHHDHVGVASKLTEHYNISCKLHKEDVRLLLHAPMYALSFANRRIPAIVHFQPFLELCIRTEEPEVRSIHTPGHTKGSVCYIFNGFVLTGDTLLYKRIGRTDLPGGSADAITGSIDKMLNELSGESVIFPGHGKPWTVGEAKQWWQELQGTPPAHTSFDDGLD